MKGTLTMSNISKDIEYIVIGGGPAAVLQLNSMSADQIAKTVVITDYIGGWSRLIGPQLMQSSCDELDLAVEGIELESFVHDSRYSPTGDEYTRYINGCFRLLRPEIRIGFVETIFRRAGRCFVKLGNGEIIASNKAIVASGVKGKLPEGVDESQSIRSLKGAYEDIALNRYHYYQDKSVVVVGSGNSALQLAGCLYRHSNDITVLVNRAPLFFPTQTNDRFACRAESQRACELSARSSQKSADGSKAKHFRIIRHRAADFCISGTSIEFSYAILKNQDSITKPSVYPNHKTLHERIRETSPGIFVERIPIRQCVLVYAYGTEPCIPNIEMSDQSAVPIYLVGGCSGRPAVNFMEGVEL